MKQMFLLTSAIESRAEPSPDNLDVTLLIELDGRATSLSWDEPEKVILFLLVELLVACCELEFELVVVVNAVFLLYLAARLRELRVGFGLFVADAWLTVDNAVLLLLAASRVVDLLFVSCYYYLNKHFLQEQGNLKGETLVL